MRGIYRATETHLSTASQPWRTCCRRKRSKRERVRAFSLLLAALWTPLPSLWCLWGLPCSRAPPRLSSPHHWHPGLLLMLWGSSQCPPLSRTPPCLFAALPPMPSQWCLQALPCSRAPPRLSGPHHWHLRRLWGASSPLLLCLPTHWSGSCNSYTRAPNISSTYT